MANPQRENGHVDIANEVLEALARFRLSGNEWQVLCVILRKTYGWQKKRDKISLSQISRMTGLSRSHVVHTVAKLRNRGVAKISNTNITTYEFNKNYHEWKVLPKKATPLPKQSMGVAQTVNGVLPKQSHTKDTITKDTITKEIKPARKQRSHPKHVQLWLDTYQQIRSVDYKVSNWGEETGHLNWMLSQCKDNLSLLESLFKIYLSDADKFIAKSGYSLRVLRYTFNAHYAKAQGVDNPVVDMSRYQTALAGLNLKGAL